MIFTSKGFRQSKKTIICPPVFHERRGKTVFPFLQKNSPGPTSTRTRASRRAAGATLRQELSAPWRIGGWKLRGGGGRRRFFPPGERHLKRKSERTRCQLCGMVFLFLFFFSAPPLLPFFVFSLSLSLSLSPSSLLRRGRKGRRFPLQKKTQQRWAFSPSIPP